MITSLSTRIRISKISFAFYAILWTAIYLMKFLKNGKNHEDKNEDHDQDHDGGDDILEINGCSVRPSL